MPLKIVTNAQCFTTAPEISGKPRHLGNPDRNNPSHFYDYPGKAEKALEVAQELQRSCFPANPLDILSCERLPSLQSLLAGHSLAHITKIQEASDRAALESQAHSPAFVEVGIEASASAGTFSAALQSVGAAYTAIDVILHEPSISAFALVWPPGHHAEHNQAMGFCYFSNAGLAALYARNHPISRRPGAPNRVAVIDIDHHRGNGTASVLCEQPDTLFVDLLYRAPYDSMRKRYTDGPYDPAMDRYVETPREFPYNCQDDEHAIASHPITTGSNIVSLEFYGTQTPEIVLERFITEALPRLRAFQPDVILWSVGLDSLQGDPIGGLGNLPGSFYTMIRGVRVAFPEAKHAGVLEGGYERRLFAHCLKPTLLALHDDPHAQHQRSSLFKRYRKHFEPIPSTAHRLDSPDH